MLRLNDEGPECEIYDLRVLIFDACFGDCNIPSNATANSPEHLNSASLSTSKMWNPSLCEIPHLLRQLRSSVQKLGVSPIRTALLYVNTEGFEWRCSH